MSEQLYRWDNDNGYVEVEPDYEAARRGVNEVAAFIRTRAVIHKDDYESAMDAMTRRIVDAALGRLDDE
jgi:hypothetical protein